LTVACILSKLNLQHDFCRDAANALVVFLFSGSLKHQISKVFQVLGDVHGLKST